MLRLLFNLKNVVDMKILNAFRVMALDANEVQALQGGNAETGGIWIGEDGGDCIPRPICPPPLQLSYYSLFAIRSVGKVPRG